MVASSLVAALAAVIAASTAAASAGQMPLQMPPALPEQYREQPPLLLHDADIDDSGFFGTSLVLDVRTRACTVLGPIAPVQRHRGVTATSPVVLEFRPVAREPDAHSHGAGGDESPARWVSLVAASEAAAAQAVADLCPTGTVVRAASANDAALAAAESARDKVIKIISNGRPSNRIDVVFMGDGYTADEADRFESDIRRLTEDMWSGETFAAVLPLFNIWAIFRPSKEHGIGVGGRPKDTAFGLYRDGTELRGIYPSRPDAARRACMQLGRYACDYPSIIGNDDYYGGLGGEFVVGTRSKTTGTVVLRHEMGHNFVSVGEEYDGGYVYSGCNAAASLKPSPWKAWLTDARSEREERSVLRVEDYAWYDLAKGPYTVNFESDGDYSKWLLKISSSGVESDGALEVYLDGERLAWNTTGNLDRAFFEWRSDKAGFSAGNHTLVFKQGKPPASKRSPIRQLCSITLHEFGNDSEFTMDNTAISMYPTWSLYGTKTYRPTNEGCLMRNMSSHAFCSVCKEGLWQNLLTRLSLIDGIHTTCAKGRDEVRLKVVTIPLAQFRPEKQRAMFPDERLTVTWLRNGVEVPELANQFDISLPRKMRKRGDVFTAKVVFETPQVRVDKRGVMSSTMDWVQQSPCA
ncbi:hypothetical protein HK105_202724 [Polyrhizophydium stewartii]|uniref:IgA peptidase M64 n=1 Tax=Polyrhizophydium stewartii TaxID=2732419 RepID=A0ABR4NEF9_9FUNG